MLDSNIEKFSFIIPTLWKSEIIFPLLHILDKCDLVDEIILIENKVNPKSLPYNKLIRVGLPKNVYVNPAWNLGISLAKNELICLCNDDVFFSPGLLLENFLKHSHLLGSFGINPDSFNSSEYSFNVQSGHKIGGGWGCLLFLKKSMFISIPNSLKIWFGDNWIVETIGNPYNFTYPIFTSLSTTSSSLEFETIVQQDILEWNKIKS